MDTFPWIISVDDHVIEPPHLWTTWLPEKYRDRGPRIERHPCAHMGYVGGVFSFEVGADDGDGPLCDWWHFEDKIIPRTRVESAVGYAREEVTVTPVTFDDMRPGCFEPGARLEDMDAESRSGGLSGSRSWAWSVSGRDEAGWASLREVLLRRRSGGVVVFVDESTEDSPPADPVDGDRFGRFLVDAVG
jgi:hypothetical protein